jgi:hypothetical protein
VWLEEEDARYIARKYPRGLGKLIAKARLEPTHGKLLKTYDRSHHTWWPLIGITPHALSEVIGSI